LTVAVPRLPAAFAGLRIAHLTDLHLGRSVRIEHLQEAVSAALAAGPDLVALTGDYVSSLRGGEAEALTTLLAPLQAPLGVYAVLGNHDYWTNGLTVTRALERAGVTVLGNRNVALRREGAILYIAGVDDVWERKADLTAALDRVSAGACTVLLAHEPDFADTVDRDGRVALQLSGHSHGGQVVFPGLPRVLPVLARKYPQGLYVLGNMSVFTSKGVGLVNPPVRFACRPEVAILDLVPAP
jgi:predicted MPP superfamily phosphohydrolase